MPTPRSTGLSEMISELRRRARAIDWLDDAERAINAERQSSLESPFLGKVECERDARGRLIIYSPQDEHSGRVAIGDYGAIDAGVVFIPTKDGKRTFHLDEVSASMSEVVFTQHLSDLLGSMIGAKDSYRARNRCETCRFWNHIGDVSSTVPTNPPETTVASDWGECRRHAPAPIIECVKSAANRSELTGTVSEGDVELSLEAIEWDQNEEWHNAYDRCARWPITTRRDSCGDHQWEPVARHGKLPPRRHEELPPPLS